MANINTNIQGLTALRVLFMLMIFVHHCNFSYGGGSCAVAGFFIMSGFCMTLGYREKVLREGFSWPKFMLRRAIRLYPIHWVGLLLMWILSGCYFHLGPKFIGTLSLNAALFQSWIPIKSMYFSYNSPSWYLCDILFFAALFPFLMRLIHNSSRIVKCAILIIPAISIIVLSIILPHELRHFWLYIHPIARLVDCMIGMYAAMYFFANSDNTTYVRIIEGYFQLIDAGIILMSILVIFQSIYRYQLGFAQLYHTIFWIPETLLVLLVALRSLSPKPSFIQSVISSKTIDYIGSCSLSFYILHTPIMNALGKLCSLCAPNANSIIGGSIALLATIIVSRISYQLIEKRLTRYLNCKLIKQ